MLNQEVRRARVIAIVMGALSTITLIAFVFAFIQQGVARENALMAKQYLEAARECEQRSEQMQLLAEQQKDILQKRNEALAQELVKLSNSKIK